MPRGSGGRLAPHDGVVGEVQGYVSRSRFPLFAGTHHPETRTVSVGTSRGKHLGRASGLGYGATVPIGYLVTVALLAWCTLFALAPPRPRESTPSNISYWFGFLVNELPFVALYCLVGSTLLAAGQGDLDSPGGWAAFGVALLATLGLVVVARRGLRAGPALDDAFSEGLSAGWRSTVDAALAARLRRRLPFGSILFWPFLVRRRDVERVADISYGDAGKRNQLDVYRHRSHPSDSPTLVYLHGGAFRSGRKNREARPLIYRLASQGWLCISANYRLSPAARFPDHLIDVKKVIAWVRERGREFGADPAVLFVAGSSAGGQLASMAAPRRMNRCFSQVLSAQTPPLLPRSLCTATTAGSGPGSDPALHPSRSSERMRHRSSWRMAIGTRSCSSRTRDSLSRGCEARRQVPSSTRSCPGRSTASICSIPSASSRSSMRSRPSPRGCARAG
jgi:alpha/beta hydrolase fold